MTSRPLEPSDGSELTDRQALVLRAVVRGYVGAAAPIGSKTLSHLLPVNISSASIRSVLAELAALGLVEKPHRSAGRVPTELGLRRFVDVLLSPDALVASERREIAYSMGDVEGEGVVHVASELLSLQANRRGGEGVAYPVDDPMLSRFEGTFPYEDTPDQHTAWAQVRDDMSKPRPVSGFATSPAFPHPEHTALPIPFPVQDRNLMILADEDVAKLRPHAPACAWVVDITIEQQPLPIATIQPEGQGAAPAPPMTGCHQPSEVVTGTEIPFAWFAQGLKIFDIADPYAPKEVAWFQPDPAPGADRVSSNDVTIDERGLIYLIDRVRGLHIVERK